jgi:hypothetical protein
MALSEIEKLERRYAENPQGLTFAPLAEVYRKSGEVQRALDLLGPGLQVHPDYIPANIVLGRCHLDLGDVHAAETAFLHVLALDGENVIALKALADISERLLKFDEAERWLHALLAVDRSNDDAREQLQRVEISRRQAGVASSAEPSSVLEAEAATEGPETGEVAHAPAIPDITSPPPRFEPPVAEPAYGWLEPSALPEEPEDPSLIQLDEPARFDEPARSEKSVEPLAGLVGRELDTPDEGPGEFRVETSEDIVLESAGGSEFQMPDASQELFTGGGRGERSPFEEDAPVAPKGAEAFTAPEAQQAQVPEPVAPESPAPEPPAPEPYAPEPFVYQPPRQESFAPAAFASTTHAPDQPSPPAAEPVTDFRYQRRDRDQGEVQPVAALPKRSYGVAETGGRSVAQLFKGILSAQPPAQAPAAPVRQAPAANAGAPTRPAADALSLSSVFGEEGSDTPPAVPASNPGAGSVSFDDFFGSPSSSSSARTPRAPDPKNDDLDQFHAWLQNLKR